MILRTLFALIALASYAGPVQAQVAADGSAWRKSIRDFAAEHFKHPAWGFSHAERDYLLARKLAAQDGAKVDDDVLYAAAYLHDAAAVPPWAKADVDHADEGARIVDQFLQGTGFPMSKVDAVRGAIRTHMWLREPVGPEAVYLHDADALDWLGVVGAARIIALIDPNGGNPTGPQVIPMLQTNLEKVPPHVLSPAGRALVEPRVSELKQFLDRLQDETDGFHAL